MAILVILKRSPTRADTSPALSSRTKCHGGMRLNNGTSSAISGSSGKPLPALLRGMPRGQPEARSQPPPKRYVVIAQWRLDCPLPSPGPRRTRNLRHLARTRSRGSTPCRCPFELKPSAHRGHDGGCERRSDELESHRPETQSRLPRLSFRDRPWHRKSFQPVGSRTSSDALRITFTIGSGGAGECTRTTTRGGSAATSPRNPSS